MARGQIWRRTAAWLFPTVGPDNDRVVPWLGSARSFPVFFALLAGFYALSDRWTGVDLLWTATPTIACYGVVTGFCGRRKDGSKIRHRVLAVITACALFAAVSVAGVWLLATAGHAHSGPLDGLVLLVAAIVAVYAFVTVTHVRHRDTAPLRDAAWPGRDEVT